MCLSISFLKCTLNLMMAWIFDGPFHSYDVFSTEYLTLYWYTGWFLLSRTWIHDIYCFLILYLNEFSFSGKIGARVYYPFLCFHAVCKHIQRAVWVNAWVWIIDENNKHDRHQHRSLRYSLRYSSPYTEILSGRSSLVMYPF